MFEEPLQDPRSTVGESLILYLVAGRTEAGERPGCHGEVDAIDGQKLRGLPLLPVITRVYQKLCAFPLGKC